MMKQNVLFTLVLTSLFAILAACNPMQQLEDAVAEEASERIAEQVLGVDNLEMNQEGDEVSFTVQGDNGEMAFASGETSSEFFEGMGFRFALPAGLGRGMLQTVDENGEAMMISASYEVQDATAESFLRAMHQTVTDAGFTYFGAMFGAAEGTEPDYAGFAETAPFVTYTHPDGFQMTLIWGESEVLVQLIKVPAETIATPEASSEGNSGSDAGSTLSGGVALADLPTVLDGSMTLDRTEVGPSEPIVVTLVLNMPIGDDAWVGVVPTDTPHGREEYGEAAYLSYAYVAYAEDGKLTLYAPEQTGTYDIRLYNTDNGEYGVELASETFTVR
jgi:hypothetical protein